MLVLHGAWRIDSQAPPKGRLFVWAESSAGRPEASPDSRTRRGKRHPFAAPADDVEAVLAELARRSQVTGFVDVGETQSETLLLPTIRTGPVPSPQLVFDQPVDLPPTRARTRLASWLVPGVSADLEILLRILANVPMHDEWQAGVEALLLGGDFRFWSHAAKLALELAVRQRFAPALALDEANDSETAVGQQRRPRRSKTSTGRATSKAWAYWAPVLDDPAEQERVATLAAALPGAAVAAGASADARKLAVPPRSTVQHFLTTAVDTIVRFSNLGAYPSSRDMERLRLTTPAERWFRALHDEPLVQGRLDELNELTRQIHGWSAELRMAGRSKGFRTCFRLEPPDETSPPPQRRRRKKATAKRNGNEPDPWRLRFCLQAIDDRSLIVPAEDVWQARGQSFEHLNRRFDHAQDRLLADLGRAVRVFPPIEPSLRDARPASTPLTDEQAYSFLREGAWLLEDSGFGVLVPNWWSRRGIEGPRIGVRMHVSGDKGTVQKDSELGLSAVVNYDWQLALGDDRLSDDEFKRLAEWKTPLVQVRGRWVELSPDQSQSIRELWRNRSQSEAASVGEALRMALGQSDSVGSLPVLGVEASGWMAALLDRLTDGERLDPIEVPPRFQGELRPYQNRGLSWLAFLREWGLGACLADDMGLGKTIQVLALLLHIRRRIQNAEEGNGRSHSRGGVQPSLVVCPTSVVSNWVHEADRFAPDLRVMMHHGTERLKDKAFARAVADHDLVVTSYALVRRDQKWIAKTEWDCVVLDEAQNIKNVSAQVTQAVRNLPVGQRIALTGTPVENRLSELWSIMEFLNPGYLGTLTQFKRDLATPIERYEDRRATQRLRNLVQPFVLRRLKTDPTIIADLPEKLEMKVYCSLTREQATLYEAIVQDSLRHIDASEGIQRRGVILATLTKLKQVCNHPTHFLQDESEVDGRSGKLERLTEMLIEALSESDRALVFTQFTEMGKMLRTYLQRKLTCEVLFLHGGSPARQRQKMVERFQQAEGGPPVFIISLKAGGTGLNLTNANHVFHYDRWWNPAVEDQATDRAFRIGQTRNVQVHKFVCAGTVEEKIDDLIETKKALAASVVAAGESWLTELSTDQLRDMLTLRPGAVVEG